MCFRWCNSNDIDRGTFRAHTMPPAQRIDHGPRLSPTGNYANLSGKGSGWSQPAGRPRFLAQLSRAHIPMLRVVAAEGVPRHTGGSVISRRILTLLNSILFLSHWPVVCEVKSR